MANLGNLFYGLILFTEWIPTRLDQKGENKPKCLPVVVLSRQILFNFCRSDLIDKSSLRSCRTLY